MMERAVLLQETINKFTTEYTPANMFTLNSQEWKYITYLIDVTRHFGFWTANIGKATGSRLGYVLTAYDELFEGLEECCRRLKPLRDPWIPDLLKGIDKAMQKLDKYYNKTYSATGSFYAFGAILSPRLKMTIFNPEYCWLDPNVDWQERFEGELRELYFQHYADREVLGPVQQKSRYREVDVDPMALLLSRKRGSSSMGSIPRVEGLDGGEIDRYLALRKSIVIFIVNIIANYS